MLYENAKVFCVLLSASLFNFLFSYKSYFISTHSPNAWRLRGSLRKHKNHLLCSIQLRTYTDLTLQVINNNMKYQNLEGIGKKSNIRNKTIIIKDKWENTQNDKQTKMFFFINATCKTTDKLLCKCLLTC